MADFQDKLKDAFDAEMKGAPVPPNLRYRVIANAVATPRRRGLSAWLTVPRLATVGAIAAVLLAAGIGLRAITQPHPITAHGSPTAAPTALLAFGKLPPAQLHPPQGQGGGGVGQAVTPYFGPANMTWAGTLPKVPATAPVFRFNLPTIADADAFAAKLGASLISPGSAKEPRTYRMGNYLLVVSMNDPVAGEPTFNINWQSSTPTGPAPDAAAARAAADAELARLGLSPSWKAAVTVSTLPALGQQAPLYQVQYQRLIDVTPTVTAGEVDGNGDPSGLRVVVGSGPTVLAISGTIRLSEQPASYPLQPPSTTVSAAVNATPLASGEGPVPSVTLTKATLVYTVVPANGGLAYLEPAYLYTGTFTSNGVTQEKRVLVPALAARALG